MRVIIASPISQSPAAFALTQEDVPFQLMRMYDNYSYGRLIYDLWNEGEPFVLLEWDVVVWPGAIERLIKCAMPWCAHRYPVYPNNMILAPGCMKVTPRGRANPYLTKVPWPEVEPILMPTLGDMYECHIHEPGVAHARPVKIRDTSEVYARG